MWSDPKPTAHELIEHYCECENLDVEDFYSNRSHLYEEIDGLPILKESLWLFDLLLHAYRNTEISQKTYYEFIRKVAEKRAYWVGLSINQIVSHYYIKQQVELLWGVDARKRKSGRGYPFWIKVYCILAISEFIQEDEKSRNSDLPGTVHDYKIYDSQDPNGGYFEMCSSLMYQYGFIIPASTIKGWYGEKKKTIERAKKHLTCDDLWESGLDLEYWEGQIMIGSFFQAYLRYLGFELIRERDMAI